MEREMFVKALPAPVTSHAGLCREPSLRPEGAVDSAAQILFVDNEPNVLEGYKLLLHGEFEVETAKGGEQAMAAVRLLGPYAIVISDMRMPGLDGAQLLARIRELAPNTVGILLAGHKDLKGAIDALSDGRIFHYLAKPCEKSELVRAIQRGLEQYHTNTEQKELLKQAAVIHRPAAGLNNILQPYGQR